MSKGNPQMCIRLTEEEFREWAELAGEMGMGLSPWVREMVRRGKGVPVYQIGEELSAGFFKDVELSKEGQALIDAQEEPVADVPIEVQEVPLLGSREELRSRWCRRCRRIGTASCGPCREMK